MSYRTKRYLHLYLSFVAIAMMSIFVHEGVHVIQAVSDDRIIEPITIELISDASYPGIDTSGFGIFGGGIAVKAYCAKDCIEYGEEEVYREAQAYSVEAIFILMSLAVFMRHYGWFKE